MDLNTFVFKSKKFLVNHSVYNLMMNAIQLSFLYFSFLLKYLINNNHNNMLTMAQLLILNKWILT